MTKKEYFERIVALEKQASGIQAELADLKHAFTALPDSDVPENLYFELGEHVYFVDADGDVNSENFSEDYDVFLRDNRRLFKCAEFVEMFAEKSQFIANLMHFKYLHDKEYVPDWGGDYWTSAKYFVFYSYEENKYSVSKTFAHDSGIIYFSTREIAEKCAEWLNGECDRT